MTDETQDLVDLIIADMNDAMDELHEEDGDIDFDVVKAYLIHAIARIEDR